MTANYFYMDDFHWLARAILAQDSFSEIVSIQGRDFNPVFLTLLWGLIKIFGISVPLLRWMSILIFSGLVFAFIYLLVKCFRVHYVIAFSASLLFGINVYISEVLLNLSAQVYTLSLLFGICAAIVWLRPGVKWRKWRFILLMALAFLTKESILLIMIPLFLYEKEKPAKWFLAICFTSAVLLRMAIQLGAETSSYTSFLSFQHWGTKLYFLFVRSFHMSPYSVSPWFAGIMVLLLSVLVFYLLTVKKERRLVYFFSLCLGYFIFSSLFPKIYM